MSRQKNTRPVRIDTELDDALREFAVRNKITIRQASKELAKLFKRHKGESLRVIKF
jgi:hypothetical protein